MDSAWWARRARSELPIPCDGPHAWPQAVYACQALRGSLRALKQATAMMHPLGKRASAGCPEGISSSVTIPWNGVQPCVPCVPLCLRPRADACPATHARRGLQAHVPAKHRLKAVCEAGCSHDVPAEHKDVMPTQNFQSCVRGQGQTLKA